ARGAGWGEETRLREEPRLVNATVQLFRNGYSADAAHNFSSFVSVNGDRCFMTAVTTKKRPCSTRTCSKPARRIALVMPPIFSSPRWYSISFIEQLLIYLKYFFDIPLSRINLS